MRVKSNRGKGGRSTKKILKNTQVLTKARKKLIYEYKKEWLDQKNLESPQGSSHLMFLQNKQVLQREEFATSLATYLRNMDADIAKADVQRWIKAHRWITDSEMLPPGWTDENTAKPGMKARRGNATFPAAAAAAEEPRSPMQGPHVEDSNSVLSSSFNENTNDSLPPRKRLAVREMTGPTDSENTAMRHEGERAPCFLNPILNSTQLPVVAGNLAQAMPPPVQIPNVSVQVASTSEQSTQTYAPPATAFQHQVAHSPPAQMHNQMLPPQDFQLNNMGPPQAGPSANPPQTPVAHLPPFNIKPRRLSAVPSLKARFTQVTSYIKEHGFSSQTHWTINLNRSRNLGTCLPTQAHKVRFILDGMKKVCKEFGPHLVNLPRMVKLIDNCNRVYTRVMDKMILPVNHKQVSKRTMLLLKREPKEYAMADNDETEYSDYDRFMNDNTVDLETPFIPDVPDEVDLVRSPDLVDLEQDNQQPVADPQQDNQPMSKQPSIVVETLGVNCGVIAIEDPDPNHDTTEGPL